MYVNQKLGRLFDVIAACFVCFSFCLFVFCVSITLRIDMVKIVINHFTPLSAPKNCIVPSRLA